jgi:hypothetical protein
MIPYEFVASTIVPARLRESALHRVRQLLQQRRPNRVLRVELQARRGSVKKQIGWIPHDALSSPQPGRALSPTGSDPHRSVTPSGVARAAAVSDGDGFAVLPLRARLDHTALVNSATGGI